MHMFTNMRANPKKIHNFHHRNSFVTWNYYFFALFFCSLLVAINQPKRLLTERTLELLNEMAFSHKWNWLFQMVNSLDKAIKIYTPQFAVERIPFQEILFPLKMAVCGLLTLIGHWFYQKIGQSIQATIVWSWQKPMAMCIIWSISDRRVTTKKPLFSMLRIILPLAFGILFLAWICYQLFVKKALKQHLEVLYIGLSFVLIWGVLFFFLLNEAFWYFTKKLAY